MDMRFKDIMHWYKLQERAIVEENIIAEAHKKNKIIPIGNDLSRKVDKEIEKRRKEIEGIYGSE